MSDDTFVDTFRSLRKHSEYYLSGGDLYFLVEDVKFRVHRYFFERESWYFRKKLNGPEGPKGTSDSTAIVLDEVAADDFARFLWVFYNPKYSLYDTTFEDWAAILDLAHHWDFPEVKKLVIRELEKFDIPDVDKIALYHEYNIDRSLLVSCYVALCEREEPITHEEGECLGLETVLNIFRAREHARGLVSADGQRQPTPSNMARGELEELMKSAFRVGQIIENTSYLNSPGGSEAPSLHQADLANSASSWSRSQEISPRTPLLPSLTVEAPISVQTELRPIEELSGKGLNEDESGKSDAEGVLVGLDGEQDVWEETSLSDLSDNTKVDSIINLNAAETEKPPLDPSSSTNEPAATAVETSDLVFDVSESPILITRMDYEIKAEEVTSPEPASSQIDEGSSFGSPETTAHTSIAEIQSAGESFSVLIGTESKEGQGIGSSADLQQPSLASEPISLDSGNSGDNVDGAELETQTQSAEGLSSQNEAKAEKEGVDGQEAMATSANATLIDNIDSNAAQEQHTETVLLADEMKESEKTQLAGNPSSQDETKVEAKDVEQASASVPILFSANGTLADNADATQEQGTKNTETVSLLDEVRESETDSFISALTNNDPADNGEGHSTNNLLKDETQSSSSIPDPDQVDNSVLCPQPVEAQPTSEPEPVFSANPNLFDNPNSDIPESTTQAEEGDLSLTDPAESTPASEPASPADPNPSDNSNADIPDSTTQAEGGDLSDLMQSAPVSEFVSPTDANPIEKSSSTTTTEWSESSLISISDSVAPIDNNQANDLEADVANTEIKNGETSAVGDTDTTTFSVEDKEEVQKGETEIHAPTSENPIQAETATQGEAAVQGQPFNETLPSEGMSSSSVPPNDTQVATEAQGGSEACAPEGQVPLFSPSVAFSLSNDNQINSSKTEVEVAENESESGKHVELLSGEAGVSYVAAVSPEGQAENHEAGDNPTVDVPSSEPGNVKQTDPSDGILQAGPDSQNTVSLTGFVGGRDNSPNVASTQQNSSGGGKLEGFKLIIPGDEEEEDDNQTFYDSPQYPPEQDSLA